LKDPAADATDAPQPEGSLCNPTRKMMKKMRVFFRFFFYLMEYRWNEIDWGKPKYSEKNLFQCHFVHHKYHPGLRGEGPTTNRLSHGQMTSYFYRTPFETRCSPCRELYINTATQQDLLIWQPSIFYMRFGVLTVLSTRVNSFWAMTSCTFVNRGYPWRGKCCLHIFCPEDGGSRSRHNIGTFLPSYKASYSKRQ
jgi:hypothetical protein